jgi:mRNA interferase HigB
MKTSRGICCEEIAGNKYRLVTHINYEFRIVYVRFVGTHREYDELDVKNV